LLRIDRHYDQSLPMDGDGQTRALLRAATWLDIETTGLSPATCHVTLFGYVRCSRYGRRLTQLFVEDPSEEPQVLVAAIADLAHAPLLVTFNGARFDLPFLRGRGAVCHVPVPAFRHRDLLDDVRRIDPRRSLWPDHRLQTLMRCCGLHRDDALSGRDMVRAYGRWLRWHRPADRDEILGHNADDLLRLPELTAVVLGHLTPQRAG